MDDLAYTRTSFGPEPSSRDVDALLGAGSGGARPGVQQVLAAFSATGILIGVVQSVNRWPTPVSCYIGVLPVHPTHRRQGIGTRLLIITEQAGLAHGCRQLLLSVIAGNTGARAFWHRQGFHLLTPHRARTAGPRKFSRCLRPAGVRRLRVLRPLVG
ncbi:GNAT family N-acetyltransferase [Kocuria nitroreducens]|uniref:GNAT family N-acetyltransferase n=1 Tax=Kocuria nitroreducens TaxID=3058914 RepID=UPI0036DDC815